MKLVLALFVSIFGQAFVLHAQKWSQAETDYGVGGLVGRCLARKCQVFTGWLETDSPKSGDPVIVRRGTQLFGVPIGSETVSVTYVDPLKNIRNRRTPDGAWLNVAPNRNELVTIVLAAERIEDTLTGEPMLVTADPRTAEIIRSIAADAIRVDASPDAISGLVTSLPNADNPAARAGYVFERIKSQEISRRSADDCWGLISQLVGSPHVPAIGRSLMIAYSVVHYTRLTEAGRDAMVGLFMELERSSDAPQALVGLDGLARLRHSGQLVKIEVSASRRAGLLSAYRSLSAQGQLTVNSEVEALLAGRPE